MNALLSRPVFEHAISMRLNATASNSGRKKSCLRFPTGLLAELRDFLLMHVTHYQSSQHVTYFPELVRASGGHAFDAHWS